MQSAQMSFNGTNLSCFNSYKLFQQYLEAHATAQRNVDNKLASINVLQPLVIPEQVFSFADAKKAFELQGSGRFVGKVIIDVADAN